MVESELQAQQAKFREQLERHARQLEVCPLGSPCSFFVIAGCLFLSHTRTWCAPLGGLFFERWMSWVWPLCMGTSRGHDFDSGGADFR